MAVHRSNRPLGWLAFGTGGFIIAFLLPIQIFLYGIAIPLGFVPDPGYQSTLDLLRQPFTRIYLFVLITLAFFHAAYRAKDTLVDVLDIRKIEIVVAYLCYGGAIVGSIAALWLLYWVP
jgi:succinate dehydrogenase subunit D